MNNFCEVTFNKKVQADLLVDIVSSILKNLDSNGFFFFIDDVLIDKEEYHFIFGGKMETVGILIKTISEYTKIKNYRFET